MAPPRSDDDARKALERMRPMLARIVQGAQSSTNGGFGWTVEMEDREGRTAIAQLVAKHPRLAEVMPELAVRLAEKRPLGDIVWTSHLGTADLALAASAAKDSFNRKPGERSRYGRT